MGCRCSRLPQNPCCKDNNSPLHLFIYATGHFFTINCSFSRLVAPAADFGKASCHLSLLSFAWQAGRLLLLTPPNAKKPLRGYARLSYNNLKHKCGAANRTCFLDEYGIPAKGFGLSNMNLKKLTRVWNSTIGRSEPLIHRGCKDIRQPVRVIRFQSGDCSSPRIPPTSLAGSPRARHRERWPQSSRG